MAVAQHTRFTAFTKEGKEFIRVWNKGYKDGLQIKMAKKFDISVCTVTRVRKKLGLEALHSGKHPGRKKFYKQIRKMYEDKMMSTLWIAKAKRMSSQGINIILRDIGVEIRKEQHCVNPLYFKTRFGPAPGMFAKEVKRLYLDEGMTCAKIAKELWVDQGSVSTKLRAMGVKVLRQNHQALPGGYPCQWCGKIMKTVWQNKGPRKQKYCNGKCKNMAKDFRRLLRGTKNSDARLKGMEEFLMNSWQEDYTLARERLIKSTRPFQIIG